MKKTITPPEGRNAGLEFWLEMVYVVIRAIELTVRKSTNVSNVLLYTLGVIVPATKSIFTGMAVARRKVVDKLPDTIRRLAKTGWMLVRISLSYRFWLSRSGWLPAVAREQALEKLHRKNAQLFTATSLEHGGAFLKVGQILSARSDVLPDAWIEELAVLQDHANPEPYSLVEQALRAALGKEPAEVFARFEEEPIAAASIGQVHEAELHDGRRVAVKIQRPNIGSLIKLDMMLMKGFLKSLESLLPETDLPTISAEVDRAIMAELDYRQEAAWMRQIGNYLSDVDGIIVPEVYDEYTSETVMVSEFIQGRKITDELDALAEAGDRAGLSDILGRVLDIYLRQVLGAGLFQADPHPGNMLVTPGGDVVLLDFGCTMELSEKFRNGYTRILFASVRGRRRKVAKELHKLGFRTKSGKPDTLLAFSDVLLKNITQLASGMGRGAGMNWPAEGELLDQAKDLYQRSKDDPVVSIPSEFIMLARVFSTLGGLFLHYKPDLDADRYLWPHLAGAGGLLLTPRVIKFYLYVKSKLPTGRRPSPPGGRTAGAASAEAPLPQTAKENAPGTRPSTGRRFKGSTGTQPERSSKGRKRSGGRRHSRRYAKRRAA